MKQITVTLKVSPERREALAIMAKRTGVSRGALIQAAFVFGLPVVIKHCCPVPSPKKEDAQ